jgi:predicted RNase H-like HicB family nuclease
METQIYTVIYEADPEGGFVASVPALPGCYSQGETLEETEANITEAIILYLESLKEEHKELPQDHIWQGRVQVAV